MRLLAALSTVGILATAGGALAANTPTAKHTGAGTSTANASLITLKVLGKGWTATKSTAGGLQVTCKGYQPSMQGLTETGAATSPSFSGGTGGPFIVQLTSVFKSAGQASALWNRAVKPGLIACVTQTLETVTAKGIKVTVSSQGPLKLAKVLPMTAAYRVVATLASKKQKLKTYFDVILVASGETVSEITISSFVSSVPANFEHALALIVAHNISIPTA
jgi:hypothetical protein